LSGNGNECKPLAVGFPHRQVAALTCRAFRDAAQDPIFTRSVKEGETIASACAAAEPGDTIDIPAGYYLETVILKKPVALVGARGRAWQMSLATS
jgi:hypothetical protein